MLNVNDPHVQEACFLVLRFLCSALRQNAREILLAATEFMCRSEVNDHSTAANDESSSTQWTVGE